MKIKLAEYTAVDDGFWACPEWRLLFGARRYGEGYVGDANLNLDGTTEQIIGLIAKRVVDTNRIDPWTALDWLMNALDLSSSQRRYLDTILPDPEGGAASYDEEWSIAAEIIASLVREHDEKAGRRGR